MKSKNLFLILVLGLFIFLLPNVSKAACGIGCGFGGPSGTTPICSWDGGSVEKLGIIGTLCNWSSYCKCGGLPCPFNPSGSCPGGTGSCGQGGFFAGGTNGKFCVAI